MTVISLRKKYIFIANMKTASTTIHHLLKKDNPDIISFHIESEENISKNIALIKSHGIKCGIAINPETLVGTKRFVEETTKMAKAIKQAKKLKGVNEILVPGERGDKIRSEILKTGKIEIEDNLLKSLKDFVS